MKDEKDLNSTKMDQRGRTPDRQKKIPAGTIHFLFSKTIQTGSGAHPASF
jgi:hypothetical protein